MKWIKFFIGFFLLPLLVAQVLTLVDFAALWLPSEPWRALWFWSIWGGVIVWLLIFFNLSRPLWIYVLGHELTHALAMMITGGKVYNMKVSSSGGHVVGNRSGWWVSLSPYFVPIYTLLWLALWWSIDFYFPLKNYYFILFFGIGFTYAFHMTFTLSMLHPGQTDLSGEGYLFSTVLILAMNLLLISLFFFFMIPKLNWHSALSIMSLQIQNCYGIIGIFFENVMTSILQALRMGMTR